MPAWESWGERDGGEPVALPSFDQQRWKDADGAFFMKRAAELGINGRFNLTFRQSDRD